MNFVITSKLAENGTNRFRRHLTQEINKQVFKQDLI